MQPRFQDILSLCYVYQENQEWVGDDKLVGLVHLVHKACWRDRDAPQKKILKICFHEIAIWRYLAKVRNL